MLKEDKIRIRSSSVGNVIVPKMMAVKRMIKKPTKAISIYLTN